jgi:group I intron endonuclease
MKGYIYKATSPSGKSYIGQTKDEIKNRWRDHSYDAFDSKKDHCKLLNRAIRKYGKDAFTLECLEHCSIYDLDEKEAFYITKYNTMKPFGYNLKVGGSSCKHTDETKEKIKLSLVGKPKSNLMRSKLSNTKKQANGSDLPQYIVNIRKSNNVVGFRITGHPNQNGTEKRFASQGLSMDEKLKLAMDYLDYLNNLDSKVQKQTKTLPKYLQVYQHGYMVKHPTIKKYFLSKKKTNDELYNDALEYLNKVLSATHLVPGSPSEPCPPS